MCRPVKRLSDPYNEESSDNSELFRSVRGMRFELTRLAALPPQSSASTNFATHASRPVPRYEILKWLQNYGFQFNISKGHPIFSTQPPRPPLSHNSTQLLPSPPGGPLFFQYDPERRPLPRLRIPDIQLSFMILLNNTLRQAKPQSPSPLLGRKPRLKNFL